MKRPVFGLALLAVLVAGRHAWCDLVVGLHGRDFSGGGATQFGYDLLIHTNVNYVYAQSTGQNVMRAGFALAEVPSGTMALAVEGLDNDQGPSCPIEIALNDRLLFAGVPPFWRDRWDWWQFPIPAGALRAGTNELRISNPAAEGRAGQPPWFMIREARIGTPQDLPVSQTAEPFCTVAVPSDRRPLPESAAEAGTVRGFQIRGMKGMLWSPETYLEEILFLAKHRFNFLMNCYTTLWDLEKDAVNRWFRPLPKEKFEVMKRVVRACEEGGIEFCFCINPALNSPQPFGYGNGEDFRRLRSHCDSFQDLGVGWFSVAFDDISTGVDAPGQAGIANRILARLRERDPDVRFILCPSVYHNRMLSEPWAREYLQVLGEELNPKIEVFWTGPGVCSWRITAEDVTAFAELIGRKPFIWDNYPVNDGAPTLHLAPLQGRSPDLYRHVSGYLFNPMYHHEVNRLPAMTIADYLCDPEHYNPWDSIRRGVLELGDSAEQQEILSELVGLHCGFPTEVADHSGFGSIEEKLVWCRRREDPEVARRELKVRLSRLQDRLAKAFPDQFHDVVEILAVEIEALSQE